MTVPQSHITPDERAERDERARRDREMSQPDQVSADRRKLIGLLEAERQRFIAEARLKPYPRTLWVNGGLLDKAREAGIDVEEWASQRNVEIARLTTDNLLLDCDDRPGDKL